MLGNGEPLCYVAFGRANNDILGECFLVAIEEYNSGTLRPTLSAKFEISLDIVPAHKVSREDLRGSGDGLADFAREVTFHKLAGARIKLCLRDLFPDEMIPRLLHYASVVRCIETVGCWVSTGCPAHGTPKIFDLIWDRTSPYITALQFISSLLSSDCQHPVTRLITGSLRALDREAVNRFEQFSREVSVCAHVWVYIRGPAKTNELDIEILAYGDLRRADAERDDILFRFMSMPKGRLNPFTVRSLLSGWEMLCQIVTFHTNQDLPST